jgi:hypothetical protein
MPPELIYRATDSIKSRFLPQSGLKGQLRREVESCFDYFDEGRRGGPISEIHANGLVLKKLERKGEYGIEIDVFKAPIPWHQDQLIIKGKKVLMRQINPVNSSPRQRLPREEVVTIIRRIQNVTVPYGETVKLRQEKRERVKSVFEQIKERISTIRL